ncbi:hypothetical protein GCM10027403_16250 [Arthrobacter tecti]
MTFTKLLLIGGTSLLAGFFLLLAPLAEIINGTADGLAWFLAAIGAFLLLEGIVMFFLGLQARKRDLNRPRTYGQDEDGKPFEDDRPHNAHQYPGAGVQGQAGFDGMP